MKRADKTVRKYDHELRTLDMLVEISNKNILYPVRKHSTHFCNGFKYRYHVKSMNVEQITLSAQVRYEQGLDRHTLHILLSTPIVVIIIIIY